MTKVKQPLTNPGQLIRPRAYQQLLSDQELEDAALSLEEKRWEAAEWARERGIKFLRDLEEERS